MLDQLGNGLLLGIIISVASVALSLLYGVTRIVNFAHGEIIALGAITTLFFSSPVDYRVLFLDKFSPLGLDFVISCFLAILICGLFGGLLSKLPPELQRAGKQVLEAGKRNFPIGRITGGKVTPPFPPIA